MSAFGKRNGTGGSRPQFGVARPMKGSGTGGGNASPVEEPEGGDQFPPLEEFPETDVKATEESHGAAHMGALDRLNQRQNSSGDQGSSKAEGFEASVHRIKERFSRGCSSESIPKPRRRSARTSWPRNSARSSARCWPSSR